MEMINNILEQYISELEARKCPDVKAYERTIDFILIMALQKLIVESTQLQKSIFINPEENLPFLISNYVNELNNNFFDTDGLSLNEIKEFQYHNRTADFKTASRTIITERLFRHFSVDLERLKRLTLIDYKSFSSFNQDAANDLEMAEDVKFLDHQIANFFALRHQFDLGFYGITDCNNEDLINNLLSTRKEFSCETLTSLIKFYSEWKKEIQYVNGSFTVDMMTLSVGVVADDQYLFGRLVSIEDEKKQTKLLPKTFSTDADKDHLVKAYDLIKNHNNEFGRKNSQSTFLALFTDQQITADYQPVIWTLELQELVFLFARLERWAVVKKQWQSVLYKYPVLLFEGESPDKSSLSSTKNELKEILILDDEELLRDWSSEKYFWLLPVVKALRGLN